MITYDNVKIISTKTDKEYWDEDKRKHRENLQKQFKKFHYYRKTNQEDYQFIKKLIENIT